MTCPGCGATYPEPHGPDCRHCGPGLGWPGAAELATLRAQLAELRAELLREHEDHAQTVIDAADVLRELREVTAQRDALRAELLEYKNALWKACGDDKEHVQSYLESQRNET
jgi:deoxyribodipyrimidine photolyase